MDLPNPAELERRCRLVAFLDTLVEPEFDERYYEFYEDWNVRKGERVTGMRSGEGDHFFIFFGKAGTLIRGREDGETAIPPAVLFRGLPPSLAEARDEKAFQVGGDSFALWWAAEKWVSAVDAGHGGASNLLRILDGNPQTLTRWVRSYHEQK